MVFDLGEALGKLTGNSTVNQLFTWQIAGQLVTSALSPFFLEIAHLVNAAEPLVPLSPAEAASAVVRGFLSEGDGAGDAVKSGVGGGVFHTMVRLAGASIAPDEAAVALRRKLIPADSGNPDLPGYQQAIQQGNLRDMWAPVIQKLALAIPNPTLALQAELEGQLPHSQALEFYEQWGADPEFYQIAFDTTGESPSPLQAIEMANRGIIPFDGTGPGVVSYEQAFLEGPWRNKWSKPFRALAEYFPPPRTVSAMYKEGALTLAQAQQALTADGVPDSIQSAYLPGQTGDPQSGTKKLALSTIETLYADRLISQADATSGIIGLGYSPADSALILAVQDLRTEMAQINNMVGRIRSLYLSGKITTTQAVNALNGLKLPGDQIPGIIQLWDITKLETTANLTAAQIADAWKVQVLDTADALTQLEAIGYTPVDAWAYLSIKNKGPLPGKPSGEIVARPNL